MSPKGLLAKIPPLDSIADSAALRALFAEIAATTSQHWTAQSARASKFMFGAESEDRQLL